MNQPPLTGSAVREIAMHSDDGALKRPFGIANWLISQRFGCPVVLDDRIAVVVVRGSPRVSPAPAQIVLIRDGPASDVPALLKIWNELLTIWM